MVEQLSPRKMDDILEEYNTIIGNSKQMSEARRLVRIVSPTNATVLVTGETGTGKELVARAIHYSSKRGEKFVPINCAAIPQELLESELFGHVKGAFTGANTRKKGKLEVADGGTAFLDEIGDMSPYLQAKILRFLQDKVINPVGSNGYNEVNVRIVAATNRNLEEEINRGNFREDLYYRLKRFPIYLLPLRERKEDIKDLAEYFYNKYCRIHFAISSHLQFVSSALDMLKSYPWPGNIRELESIMENLAILNGGKHLVLSKHDFAGLIRQNYTSPARHKSEPSNGLYDVDNILKVLEDGKDTLPHFIDYFRRTIYQKALEKSGGNVQEAARILGVVHQSVRDSRKL